MNKPRSLELFVLAVLLAFALATTSCVTADSADDPAEDDDTAQTASRDTADSAADDGKPDESANDTKKKRKKKKNAKANGEDDEEDEEQAVPVEVVELARGPIESVLKFTSTLEAERHVKVFSEAARLVRELHVEEGDAVRRGQVLVRLQDEEQRNALSRVKNELAQAEREYKRQERLYSESLISEEDWNKATFDLEQLRISVSDAERELGYTEVKAPISGVITERMVNLGDQVTVGQHLFNLIDFDSIVARVYVPEKHLAELRPGQSARVSARAVGGKDYSGRLSRISPVVDPQSGTVKVTVDVGGQPGLRPGMYVDVDLITATHSEALLVPKRALVYDNDQMFVFRLAKERRVDRVFVEPRLSDKNHVMPGDGLAAGDVIVVAGQAGLKDGALVSLPGDKQRDADQKKDEDAATDKVAA